MAFGAFLRETREGRWRLTVHQIAATTKIPRHHFSSLQSGDVRRWPGGMYRRAMVRACARAIGLDAEETVRTFVAVFSEGNSHAPIRARSFAADQPRARSRYLGAASATGVAGAAAAILLIVVVRGVLHRWRSTARYGP